MEVPIASTDTRGMILIVRGHINTKEPKYENYLWRMFGSLGKALRKRRMGLGVSQEEFADLCGLDRTYVGGIERGERNVSLVNLEKLAKALKIPLSELFRSV